MNKTEIKGRAIGAKARADALSPARRSEIAKAAAAKRWPKTLQATHKGSFKEDFGIDVECYVLDDETHTAVISQTGMGVSLGLAARGSAFPRFLATQGMAGALGAELEEKINNPLKFQWVSPGAQQTGGVTTVNGYDVTMLIDVCKAIIKADGDGKLRNERVTKQAAIIIGASAKSGIQGLVYKLAGYNATKEEVVAAFKLYVREEAREYEKEFPDQLYREWYRLYQLPEIGKTTKPWKFRHLTVDQVYWPLARSNGKILELTQAKRARSEARYKKLHQFLSEIGVKALRTHLGQLLGIAQVSRTRDEYERHVDNVFGDQRSLDLQHTETTISTSAQPQPSEQSPRVAS